MTTRDKQLVLTINHNTGTTAAMLLSEFIGPDGQWWPMQPVDATGASAAIDAFTGTLIGSQQAQIIELEKRPTKAKLDEANEQIAALTAERDARPTQAQLDAANARIAELETQLNPPNPFPDADWANFRFAILADEAINRVASQNTTAWPLMVLYLSELDSKPSRGPDIAALWNFMEAHTAIDATEIERINAIAQAHGVPLQMDSEGQIVLP